jgi:flagellar hook protein FlgE
MDVRIGATNSISAVSDWLAALSGNLTGSTVVGFRQTRVQFEYVLTEHIDPGSPAIQGSPEGSIDPLQFSIGGVKIKSTRTDWSQGSLNGTQRPTDLAISGNGFFVLSKVPNPTSLSDLVFTRNGSFTFDLQPNSDLLSDADKQRLGPNSQIGVLRLVNQDGMFVMGVTGDYRGSGLQGVPGTPLPFPDGAVNSQTISGITGEPGRLSGTGNAAGNALGFKPFTFPFIKDSNGNYSLNDDLLGRLSFDKNGMLSNTGTQDVPDSSFQFESTGQISLGAIPNGAALGTGAGIINGREKYNKYVSVATMATPDGLTRNAGTSFTWHPQAGSVFVGIAATQTGPVGATNEISAGSLETSNSSVNTALPELTIAQKSFTANVKIVSVGNTMVDDVNQLIR